MLTLENVLEPSNLQLAMEYLLGRKESCGIDNVQVSEFQDFWEINGTTILERLRLGIYEPDIVLEKEIVGKNGKRRIISMFTCTDRFLLRAINQLLQPACEGHFLDCSHAYRESYSVETAVRQAVEYISAGGIWMAEVDVEHFFDNIPIHRLEQVIDESLELDELLRMLLKSYLRCRIQKNGRIATKQAGVVQGNPISPTLSNLFMTMFDSHMIEQGYAVVRYADDIRIFVRTDMEAVAALEYATKILETLGLAVNQEKSGVFQSQNRRFLGYYFEFCKNGEVVAAKKKKQKVEYHNWHKSSIQKLGHNFHLINDGILSKQDFTVLFENEDGKRYLPIEVTDSINIYSDVIFTSNFFEFLAKKRVRLTVYDTYGNGIGSFYSERHKGNGKTMMKQTAVYLDTEKRLAMAKELDTAAMHNLRSNLRYYKKQKKSEVLNEAVQQLTDIIKEMESAPNLEKLMLSEARGRQLYYQSFSEIISNEDFRFIQRTKRPPKDPLNALISFGNVYLYNRIATEIYKTSLDIRIGFLHSTNSRTESLNLDIAELFKPILIDRTIFTLINKRMIDAAEHFENVKDGGVYLNKAGKRLFLEELDNKMFQSIQIAHHQRTYDYIMREEVQKVLRTVLHDVPYKAYKYTT